MSLVLHAAGMRGVTICNTPGINAFAVAEHALTLMLTVARRVVTIDAEMRKGKWPRELLTQCVGKTLGVFVIGDEVTWKRGDEVIAVGYFGKTVQGVEIQDPANPGFAPSFTGRQALGLRQCGQEAGTTNAPD